MKIKNLTSSQSERLRREGDSAKRIRKNEEYYPEFYADVYGFDPKTSDNIVYEPNMDKYPARERV